METRSQRRLAQQQQPSQQQQPQQARPAYPQIHTTQSVPISPSASAFQSSSSLASVASLGMAQPTHLQPHHHHPGFASAPLPSPSAVQPASYFQHAHPAQQARIPPSQAQAGGGYLGQRGGGSGAAPETAPFLQDFSLVAEAAKRAQMACLARDLGDVGL